MPEVPFHKTALLALLTAHPERAFPSLKKLIGGLPDSLDYSDLSSANLAQEMLEALTEKPTFALMEFARGGATEVTRVVGLHHLVNEGGPVCNCGWVPNTDGGREAERQAVREHIAEKKKEQAHGG